jgi:hypothetical protein
MIFVKPEDINKILKIVSNNKLVIAHATYLPSKNGKFNMLGFLANIVNKLQKFTRKKRDDLNYYWAHSFVLINDKKNIWVFEMDIERGGKLNHLFQCNTFRNDIHDGKINIYTLPEEFKMEDCKKLLKENIGRKYNLRKALTHATFIPKWIYIFFAKKPKSYDMCSQNIIDRWLPIVKKDFNWQYDSKMPEDIKYYLKEDLMLEPTTLKIVNEQIQWNN